MELIVQQNGIVSHSIKEYGFPEMLDSSDFGENTDIGTNLRVVKRRNTTSIVGRYVA